MRTLSIRQPWAWLIVNGWKDIENRTWPTPYTGPLLVHAGKGMTHDEYEEAVSTAHVATRGAVQVPEFRDIERGGIVGLVNVTGCVRSSDSLWFFGPYGFTLTQGRPLAFRPMKGQLGFWDSPDAP